MSALLTYRKNKGLTQQEVAEYLGMSFSGYSRIENGKRSASVDILQKLASLYGVTVDDLLSEKEPEPFGRQITQEPKVTVEDEVMIPVIASLRCGFDTAGMPYDYQDEKPVPKSWILKWGKSIVYNEAIGNSMLPTIRPRDLMICVPGTAWEDGDIVIVDVNDTDTVKRIYRSDDGGIDLVPDNEKYKEMHYSPKDLEDLQIHVLGRVVKVIGPDLYPQPRRRRA